MEKHPHQQIRVDRMQSPTLRNWEKPPRRFLKAFKPNAAIEMGWGRILFGHTFETNEALCETMLQEIPLKRDIAFYLRDPHVLLSMAPDRLFLDPSHTYRLWEHDYRPSKDRPPSFSIRRACSREDAERINQIYQSRNMVTCDPEFILDCRATKLRTYLVAESLPDRQVVGTVTGVDHVEAFDDPENGASLWCLAVDPGCSAPGIGEALVRQLVEHYFTRGRAYVDLSVMHDNHEAIGLYEKIGFQRVPVFCVKLKNPINEALYMAPLPEQKLNPYALIIIQEARRRGIGVEILDEELPLFSLNLGGRSIHCHESLTDVTSAVAMVRCDDKRLTRRVLKNAGLRVPRQFQAGSKERNLAVLEELNRVVVKPARGEQGRGISVDLRTPDEMEQAIDAAHEICRDVIIEEYVHGVDLRVIVIGFKFVAAAVRRPPMIAGTGKMSIEDLIEKYNRRREAATGGESRVPLDDETLRCIRMAGWALSEILPADATLVLRKTANLHTGGTIHDVTDRIHPDVIDAAENASRALNIPVTGLDLCLPDLEGPDYYFIEANERPGLANHEPQPVPARFIDFLFPETAASPGR